MEKKFTRAMVCGEFKSKCGTCPLHSCNNPKSLPCWLIDESDIQTIMDNYPYADVKVRMVLNDIETRLTAVEKKVENNVSVEFKPERVVFGCSYNRDIGFSAEVVDKKLYDKLEAKHEADCRLISEYDLENKRLEKDYDALLSTMNSLQKNNKYKELFHSLNHKHQKVVGEMKHWKERAIEAERNEDYLKRKFEKPEKLRTALETENSALRATLESVTESYDKLKADYCIVPNNLETTKEKLKEVEEKCNKLIKENKLLSESNNNHATDNIELEGELEEKTNHIAALEEKVRNQRTDLTSLQEKYEDALKTNKAREAVYYQNQILAKNIKAKDREICLLRAELDKYKTDDECDDRWID